MFMYLLMAHSLRRSFVHDGCVVFCQQLLEPSRTSVVFYGLGMKYNAPAPSQGIPAGYGMDAGGGSSNTKEQLTMMLNRRMGGSMPESFEAAAPPPQYPAGTQFNTRMNPQSFMGQPPGYGTPSSAAQGASLYCSLLL